MQNRCDICNKDYSSYQSLWNHNKRIHNTNNTDCLHDVNNCLPIVDNKLIKYTCKICNKTYDNRNSKYRHQKKCIIDNKNNIKELEMKLTTEIDKLKTEMKIVKHRTNKKVINNTNNGTIINNNVVINKIGTEDLLDFNDNEITQIFNKELEGIITFIELLNFNERLPHNHNYCTTSLESKYLSTYNKETNMIEKDRKKYFFDKLLSTSIDRIEILYTSNKKQFNKSKQKQIEENIMNLKTLKNYDFNNKILKEMINKMNLVSYNKRKLVQKTWHEDSDSDDDFQRDLEKETKEEFYKKLEMKEKLELQYKETSSSESEKYVLKSIPNKVYSESDETTNDISNIFMEIYKN